MPRTLPLESFRVHDHLNPVVWDDDGHMRHPVRDHLMDIAERFRDYLGVDVKVHDVWLTGSLANYNWSQYSDVDLHLLLDFKEVGDEDVIRELMLAKKDVWNDRHDVRIGPFDVELYAQDVNEPHEATGVYSVWNDRWLRKPSLKHPKIDMRSVTRKARQFMRMIDRVLDDTACGHDCLDDAMDRIKRLRQCGLEEGGEYSVENLAFKVLRRNGYLERLAEQRGVRLDDELSLVSKVARTWLLHRAMKRPRG